MRVLVDDRVVWEGPVDRDALEFDGPVGIRTDNAKLEFELWSGQATRPSERVDCRSADSD